MNTLILYPTKVTALRIGNEAKVTITANGYQEGLQNIRIVKSLATIYPPIYLVEGDLSPAIGYFPYTVSITVDYSTDFDYIQFSMAGGTQHIPILDVIQEHKKSTPKTLQAAIKKSTSGSNTVVGYAYNSTDINKALADAVTKLQVKFPANVSAIMTETGFVAVGSPVGIAYTYVVMEQRT